jgi:RNA polymerase sigma-70 factor (ECF subfamily)
LNQTEIIVQLQQGDQQAFKKLLDEWQDLVYNTVVGIVQDENDADEITQDVFIQVHQSIPSFKGESSLSTWLYKIAVNKSLDHLKRHKRKKRFAFIQGLFETGSGIKGMTEFNHPGVELENKEKAGFLFKAMQQLPEKQRVAFILHKLEAQTNREVAAILDLSIQATESLLARAKINLRKILKAYYEKNIN